MRMPSGGGMPRVRRRTVFMTAGVVIVLLIVLGILSSVYTDLLWFREVGFSAVFTRRIYTKVLLGVVFGVVFAAALLVNLWIAHKITNPARVFSMRDQVIERYRLLLRPYVRWVIIGGSILVGIFAGSSATGQWKSWLLFQHAQPFLEKDPVFHKDLSFFVFRLPFHRFVFTWGFSSLVVITLVVIAAHYFMGGIRVEGNVPRVAPHVKAHLSVLLGLIVVLKAWGYRLDQFNLLWSGRGGQVTGASYTDVHAQLPALKLLVIIALLCGVLFLVNIRFRGWVLPAAGLGILALTSIIAGGIYPAAVQRFSVNPVERQKETPFIARNIHATREAFMIDDAHVDSQELPAAAPLTQKVLAANKTTVDIIRLWSPGVLSFAYTQLQRITPYYEFLDVDVDRYPIGGTNRQIMLSAREVFPAGLPGQARTWVNNHLVYTHGYGVVASRVDEATPEGQPDFVIHDTPPISDPGAPPVKEPRIYFGENNDPPFVVAKTSVDELDYPTGQTGFHQSAYDGKGGIAMSSVLRKLAFAWRFKDVNLLISGAIKSDSRLMFRRSVAERVATVAPFLQLDNDPYIVVANNRLTWVIDAYTTTSNFPYSQRVELGDISAGHLHGRMNYIRNSVKATVDAFNGTVTLYMWDEKDPLIQTWSKIFPRLIRPKKDMPPAIAAHVRYPEDLFRVQSDRYATYHITDPVDFYSKNDVWRIPPDPTDASGNLMPPYYVLMKLPRDTSSEFVIMIPFTPYSTDAANKRQNMTAWLAARSDGTNYGHLLSFVYAKDQNVFGPEQIDARIQQDPNVAKELTFLDPTKSRIQKGNLLVIPVGDALLYVEPLYLTSPSSNLPEFKRVVVVTRDQIRISDTLAGALSALFGQAPPSAPSSTSAPTTTLSTLIADALRHYQAGQAALERNDFASYGREQAAMKRDLDRAQQIVEGSGSQGSGSGSASPSPSPS